MEWIFWYLSLAADSVYLLAPLGFSLWLVYRLFRLVFPKSKYLAVPFVLIGVIGGFAIEAFPGYNYKIEKQKKAADFPHVIAHVLSTRSAIYNPITWIWEQPTGFIFVSPTEVDFLNGMKNYEFGADENTFMVSLSNFDYNSNVEEQEYNLEYHANCPEKLQSVSGPDSEGVMRWLTFNEPMGEWEYERHCETDYTVQFNILQCMRKVLESRSTEATNSAIVLAGQECD